MANDQDLRSPSAPRLHDPWRGMARVVRPTLIAAIGGTGTAAAKAARSRIDHFIGPKHPFVAFRAFDTAYQDPREPRFVDNAEYVYLGGFNAQAVIGDIVAGKAFAHWKKWLPPRLNFQQVAFGAGGIRPIGRLCYFYRRERVQTAVHEALTSITDADQALRFHQQTGIRVNLEAGIDIHVVCSVCGGTGAGMFLDMAFDLRKWAEEHTDREVTVTGHVVLPEAFRRKPVVLKALEANAYTALQELDRFMNAAADDPWTVEHIQGREEKSWRAPFDHCYLMSGLQQGGTTEVDSLTAVIGEAIFISALSQVGQRVSEGVINMAGQRKSTRDEKGRLCCYGSYGVLGLEIPEGLLGEALGPRLAKEAHERLAKPVAEEPEAADQEVQRFREVLQLDLNRVEKLVPAPSYDAAAVDAVKESYRESTGVPQNQFQLELRKGREKLLRELEAARERELWNVADLRRYLLGRLQTTVLEDGGLDRALKLLARVAEALRSFRADLRREAQKAETEAQPQRTVAEDLERSPQTARAMKDLLPLAEQWIGYHTASARAEVLSSHALKLERLITLIDAELLPRWRDIQTMFGALRLEQPRDEDAYYRLHRARASVCPLSYFIKLLEPHLPGLLKGVIEDLVQASAEWTKLTPKELNERFYALCTEAVTRHFRGEAGFSCDRLLADYFEHPSSKYQTEVEVLLSRARANWELHESYALRNNLLEIAAIGARADSTFHRTLQLGSHQISAVDDEREDYLPLFRTEHGLSLLGLKRLGAYRESLLDSILHEQRYDLHFFSDQRWITRLEFADEDEAEQRRLYTFSAAEMLSLLERKAGTGYWLNVNGSCRELGRYRRQAFMRWSGDAELRLLLEGEVAKRSSEVTEWRSRLAEQVTRLRERLAKVDQPHLETGELLPAQFLSLDIYQINSEIRALLAELKVEDVGL